VAGPVSRAEEVLGMLEARESFKQTKPYMFKLTEKAA
jgi:hypothetical protein